MPHDPVWQQSAWRSRLRKRLLDWFGENQRDLPWRAKSDELRPDPYRVWVSEIMLQQTQVATVIPYYERFLDRFPTVTSLAAADEQTMLSLWEGLGYYRRARSLHAAAKVVCEKHQGTFPDDYTDVIGLPGIGRYTAGAILSIAFNQKLPILEGNTQRVFSRWVALRAAVNEKPVSNLLWQLAEAMLPPAKPQARGPGQFNQAAMELGALVCTPRSPRCDLCPIRGMCKARIAGLEQTIPGKVKQIEYEKRIEYAFLIADRSRKRFLVRPIPEGQRWAGLWDFPRWTRGDVQDVDVAAAKLGAQLSSEIAPLKSFATIKHAVTKYRIELKVYTANIASAGSLNKKANDWSPVDPWRFMTLTELNGLPMSVTGRRITKKLIHS
ncbi:A/G-specific adenine glycosylase [Novipirellula artificiosorum]|uniref:Adenine DNA glycosylase n=1 Tax=Novipirellula artificiosorum TaxID=2528016 RepID=A0A5C6E106_9BACT|nr:A/G-specific adenine glycosylase [Novipirellula artificiosorum]